jgi:glucose-1-phosphate adenylyltransferase
MARPAALFGFDRPAAAPAPRPRGLGRREEVSARTLRSTYAIVLAGGRGTRLMQLTDERAKPAVPFAGNLRIIDFTLSNCINSGIRRVSVLTQYKAQSLIRHVTRTWGFLDAARGEFVDVVPAQQQIGAGWYSGTADAVYQNLKMLRQADPEHVLVLAGDHVYKMDYGQVVAEHVRRGADVTVACVEVPLAQASAFGVMGVDAEGRITAFAEKPASPVAMPGRPESALASMGVYVFDAAFLYRELCRDAAHPRSCHDFGCDIIPRVIASARVVAHDFSTSCVDEMGKRPYWRDVGTLDAYWEANMDLIGARPELNLDDDAWPIRGRHDPLPPSRFVFDEDGRRGMAVDSLVAGGCVVRAAQVRRSLLFSQVRIGDGSLVEDSLLLPGVTVGRDVVLRRVIVDAHCVLPDGIKIGVYPGEDRARFTVTASGLTLVTPAMLAQGAPVRP